MVSDIFNIPTLSVDLSTVKSCPDKELNGRDTTPDQSTESAVPPPVTDNTPVSGLIAKPAPTTIPPTVVVVAIGISAEVKSFCKSDNFVGIIDDKSAFNLELSFLVIVKTFVSLLSVKLITPLAVSIVAVVKFCPLSFLRVNNPVPASYVNELAALAIV